MKIVGFSGDTWLRSYIELDFRVLSQHRFDIIIDGDVNGDDSEQLRIHFELDDQDAKDIVQESAIVEQLIDYIKFDNQNKIVVPYNPRILYDEMHHLIDALNRDLGLKNLTVDRYNLYSITVTNFNLNLTFNDSKTQRHLDIGYNPKTDKVFAQSSTTDVSLEFLERIVAERMNPTLLENTKKLIGGFNEL